MSVTTLPNLFSRQTDRVENWNPNERTFSLRTHVRTKYEFCRKWREKFHEGPL